MNATQNQKALMLLWLLGLAITACMTSPLKTQIYLPTFIPTQTKPMPTAYAVAPPLPRPTTELILPTQNQFAGFGTDIAQQSSAFQTQLVAGAVEAAEQSLAQTLGISKDQISIVNVENVTWPDTCFGLSGTNLSCDPFSMPGYRITLGANSQTYLYYTDSTGSRILLVTQP